MELREDYFSAKQADGQEDAAYHQRRLQKITDGDSLSGFPNDSGYVLHVIPRNAFNSEGYYQLGIEDIQHDEPPVPVNPYTSSGRADSYGRTATGTAVQRTIQQDGETVVESYTHVSTTGIIEAVAGRLSSVRGQTDGEYVSASVWEAMVVSTVQSYTSILERQGIDGPFAVHLSLFNMENVTFRYDNARIVGGYEQFTADTVAPFPTVVESQDSDAEMRSELESVLESVWRAAGYDNVHSLDQNGDWELEDDY